MSVSPAASTAPRCRNRSLARIGVLVLIAGLLGACGSDDSDDSDDSAGEAANPVTTTVAAGADPTSTTAAQSAGGDTSSGQGQSGGGGGSNGQSGGGAPASAPTITTFTTPDDIDCHNGGFQMFTASWTTTDAVRVTISVDGPGIYSEHSPNGETDLPFNCASPHTFALTAYGADGQSATKSVTLQPRNVQGEGGDDTDDTDDV